MRRIARVVGSTVKSASPWWALTATVGLFASVEPVARAVLRSASALGLSDADGGLIAVLAVVLAGFGLAAGAVVGSAYQRQVAADATPRAIVLVAAAIAACVVFGGSAAQDVIEAHGERFADLADHERAYVLQGTLSGLATMAFGAAFVATSHVLMIRQELDRWRDRAAFAVLTFLIATVLAPLPLIMAPIGVA